MKLELAVVYFPSMKLEAISLVEVLCILKIAHLSLNIVFLQTTEHSLVELYLQLIPMLRSTTELVLTQNKAMHTI